MLLLGYYLLGALLFGIRLALAAEGATSCECIGVDYFDAGSYLIDSGVDGNFSFASEFQGNCDDSTIGSNLRDSDGNSYNCSSVTPLPTGSIQISTCDIKYSSLTTGVWEILIFMSSNDTISRSFKLTVGAPATVVTTITPTIVIGTTIAPPPATITSTAQETTSTTLQATTLTTACGAAATVTSTFRQPPTTVIQTSTFLQYTTDGKVTRSTTVLSTLTPWCRFTVTVTSTVNPGITAAPTTGGGYTVTPVGSSCLVAATGSWGGGGWRGSGWGGGRGGGGGWRGPPAWITSLWAGAGNGGLPSSVSCVSSTSKVRRIVAAIAAWTSTYVQTTYTATETSTVYLPTSTVTKYAIHTVVQTITPAPSTLCAGVNMATMTLTATMTGPRLTKITIVTSVTHIIETVFITSTQMTISNDMAAETSCWKAGGAFGV